MAARDDEIRNDQAERDGLQKAISEVETQLSVSTTGTRAVFEQFLKNAKGRVATLETKIHEAEREKEQHAESEAALGAMAEKETALNEKEKEQYSGFLKEDFFTKKDFGKLEEFYAHTWDRLSDRGKNEMSHRIWEGVRRDEYKFSDLPKSVQEKEEKQAYQLLRNSAGQSAAASQIPAQDRADYLRAYESKSRDDAAKVLDRQSFKANMFRDEDSTPVQHAARNVKTPAEAAEILARANRDSTGESKAQSKPVSNIDVSSIDLSGMALGENSTQGAAANLPKPQNGNARGA